MILASKSPRRKELMERITPSFQVIPSGVDERAVPEQPVQYMAERLARAKATDVASRYPEELVVGCDTVVLLGETVYGKPKDAQDAARMLRELSGKVHSVITGVALVQGDRISSFSQETRVKFFSLSDSEIDSYIKTGEPMDKAGAYGIQGQGCLLVEEILGDFFNVVGLPVARLKREISIFMNRT